MSADGPSCTLEFHATPEDSVRPFGQIGDHYINYLPESTVQALLRVIEEEDQLSLSPSDFRDGLGRMRILSKRSDGGPGCYYKVSCPLAVATVYIVAWAHHIPFHMRVTRGQFMLAVHPADYSLYDVGAHHAFVNPRSCLNDVET